MARFPKWQDAERRLLGERLPSPMLGVLAANPSRYFYERVGGRRIADRQLDMGRFGVPAVAYGWPDLADAVRRSGRTHSRIG